jgi:hypothetical protein
LFFSFIRYIQTMRRIIFTSFLLSLILTANAQDAAKSGPPDTAYLKMITQRTAKIVDKLELTDNTRYKRVLDMVVKQYTDLREIHDERNSKVKGI